ncbi:type III secretion system (T3SS) SseB-like protein [Knoellia remsis]|uniref:Type III secretion system (T3SS) SseB-like protein n=1 Tax=Knoellia remsis TaxID=407159 RepID=A0A2T0V109_9MICO|nr:SseB family protein [Knoellia remsis]PRY63787.1 type III secretion system (T3SS) SseB-like protein [Knoellia remsis]
MTRDLVFTGFEGDDGSADPAVEAALVGEDPTVLMAVLATARLLVPIVAEPVETDLSDEGLAVDKRTDMAAVTLVAPDGERALPVFTSAASLAAWDPQARPVPVTSARAGQAAVSERCDVIVVDVAGPVTRVLRPSMVWALAQQREWVAPHLDPFVAAGVARAVAEEPEVRSHSVEEGAPAGSGVLGVVLELVDGLDAPAVQRVATRVGERLATDGELRARLDGLAFRIR